MLNPGSLSNPKVINIACSLELTRLLPLSVPPVREEGTEDSLQKLCTPKGLFPALLLVADEDPTLNTSIKALAPGTLSLPMLPGDQAQSWGHSGISAKKTNLFFATEPLNGGSGVQLVCSITPVFPLKQQSSSNCSWKFLMLRFCRIIIITT